MTQGAYQTIYYKLYTYILCIVKAMLYTIYYMLYTNIYVSMNLYTYVGVVGS